MSGGLNLLFIGLLGVGLIACGDESGSSGSSKGSLGESNYKLAQAEWEALSAKPLEVEDNTGHDPDGVGWIETANWQAAEWDGTTVYDPTTMTQEDFAKAICPGGDTIRGIREVFYEHEPFADNKNPTQAEIDEWHTIAINHVRALVGYTEADRQVKHDPCMAARARWGQERRFTTRWDKAYPGTEGSAYGPCQEGTNAHCGATFIPDYEDQLPYLPEGHTGCSTQAGAEGVSSAPKANIPWSIKWSRAFCEFLETEGFWGGHVGPFFHREKFGFSFWDVDPDGDSNAVLRAKWTGELKESRYDKPGG